jgi:hypothetical protein
MDISRQVSPHFADTTMCLPQPEQRSLVHESGMIRTQMGNTIDQKMVAVYGMFCTIPHRNTNQ